MVVKGDAARELNVQDRGDGRDPVVSVEILEDTLTPAREVERIASAVSPPLPSGHSGHGEGPLRAPRDIGTLALYGRGGTPYNASSMAKRRVHLTFPGTLADEPIMWQLSRDYGLVFNIRQADMAESVGWMMLQLEGDEEALDRGIRWLEDKGIKVAPIEQDVIQ